MNLSFFIVCGLTLAPAAFPMGSSRQAKEIKIGYVGALSGGHSESANKSLKALRLVLAEYNSKKAMRGMKFQVIPYDNKNSPILHFSLFKQMKKDGIVALTGIHTSNDGLIAAKLAQKYQIPTVIASATHPALTKSNPFVVRVCFNDEEQSKALVKFAIEQVQSKYAVILMDVSDSFSISLASLFRKKFEKHGGTILKTYSIRSNQREFSNIASELSSMRVKPDLVFSGASAMVSGYLMTFLSSHNLTIPVLGNDGWQNANLASAMEKLTANSITAYFPVHWDRFSPNKKIQNLLAEYSRTYAEELTQSDADAVLTYDAGHYLAKAIKDANSLSPQAIMKKLKSGTLDGVTGKISMKNGLDPIKDISILSVKQ